MGKTDYGHTATAPVKFSATKGEEFWHAKSSWTSLAFFELSEHDRAYALDSVLPLTTGKKAIAFVEVAHDGASPNEASFYWSYHVLDKLGECIVVRFRGVDIRLLYKRRAVEHPISELAPVPDKPVIDEEDAWIYLDLAGGSARELHAPTLARLKEMDRTLASMRAHVVSQNDVIIENERDSYARAVEDMRTENKAVEALLQKVEQQQAKIPKWALRLANATQGGKTVEENEALYGVARRVCHEFGIDWTDPRTGKTYKASAKGGGGDAEASSKAKKGKGRPQPEP